MKVGEAFPSKYLAASDIPVGGVTVTIESYEVTDIGQGERKQRKPVLYFRNAKKGLILNKTNARTIEAIFGTDELDDWVGQPVTLVARVVEFQGDEVEAIRIKVPQKQRSATVDSAFDQPGPDYHTKASAAMKALRPTEEDVEDLPF